LLGLIVATPLLTVLQIVVTTLWLEGGCKKPPTDQPPAAEPAPPNNTPPAALH
jgi:hypothetical protein